ncbi:MAG: aminotransferase class V-fold PLP-dependent enzyme [Ignavibacteriales bacterium]|jgi:selenocysteine lyase/cysteine desulfurase|nr:aminotransferase class V-fold PLP-dependent enzyme [Ignavibacteriales bacterium]
MSELEKYFSKFRKNIVGIDADFETPFGTKKIIYADWIASGRLYKPIEEKLCNTFGPYVANTHSESSVTGTTMTLAYHQAHKIIKEHVNANQDDVIITAGSGMTTVICKFQRLLGLKIPEQLVDYVNLPEELKPVVFTTHMEHHSNQTTWIETIAEVVVINPNDDGLVDVNDFRIKLEKYKNRKLKIGAFTAASNVTGIESDYHELAKIIHKEGGYCFVDFACSAPYTKIDMHPSDPEEKLDAIFFSPHKFLGGPGTPGVLVFDSKLYHNKVPDLPGGGTVDWTNPWGQHKFVANIEAREDGGTPAFLQTIKAALCIKLKEEMTIGKIRAREEELVKYALDGLKKIPTLHILAGNIEHRLGAISFYVENIHYNLLVKLLNDRYGVQVRGGCSCAGTYGHYLLHVDPNRSKIITDKIDQGDLSEKPGWVRMSIHPTMTNEELKTIIDGIAQIINDIDDWSKDYIYDKTKNEYFHKNSDSKELNKIKSWFTVS